MNPKCKTCKHKLNSVFKGPCNECLHSDSRYTDKYEAAVPPDTPAVKPLPEVRSCGTCFWGIFSRPDGDKCATCDPTTFSNYKRAANFTPLKHAYDAAMPSASDITAGTATHPLQEAYDAAIAQATGGKGVRHGGDSIPFFDQPWYSIAKHTGECGLIFQGVKKAQEACGKGKSEDEAFERELLGSLVYLGMAYLYFKRHGRK